MTWKFALWVAATLLAVTLGRIIVHRGERYEYDLSKKCLRDNCVVQSYTVSPPLSDVVVVNKTEARFRTIPAEDRNFDRYSASTLYNAKTGNAFLVLLFNNETYAIASLSDLRKEQLRFKHHKISVPFRSYRCTKFQEVFGGEYYNAFCLARNPTTKAVSFFYIVCEFSASGSMSPNCSAPYSPVGCNLSVESRYILRTNLQDSSSVHVIFNRSDGQRPGGIWVIRTYTNLSPLRDGNIELSLIRDFAFMNVYEGHGAVVTTSQGLGYGFVDTETSGFTAPLVDVAKFTEFCAKKGRYSSKTHVYAFSPNTCSIKELSTSADGGHFQEKRMFTAFNDSCTLKETHTAGKTCVKLQKYMVVLANNGSETLLLVYHIKDSDNKYIFASLPLPADMKQPSLLLVNPGLDTVLVVGAARVLLVTIHSPTLVLAVDREKNAVATYSIGLVFASPQDPAFRHSVALTVKVLEEASHPVLLREKGLLVDRVALQGWSEENNIHMLFSVFSGDNVTVDCIGSRTLLARCKSTQKLRLLESAKTEWNLNPMHSSYILAYSAESPFMSLWQFETSPKHFSLPSIAKFLTDLMPVRKKEEDIAEAVYFGNEFFSASTRTGKMFTSFRNGYGSIISQYEMTERSLSDRRFVYASAEFDISGLKYHEYKEELYMIMIDRNLPINSYVGSLNQDPIRFPYTIDYMYFTKLCTVMFHSRAEVSVFFGWDILQASPANSTEVSQYSKVVNWDDSFFLFVQQCTVTGASCVEHMKLDDMCGSLMRVKTYYMRADETFGFNSDGNIVSTVYLGYLLFISCDSVRAHCYLNVLNIKAEQNDFLYTSVTIQGVTRADVVSSGLLCLRIMGRNIVVLIGHNFYHYYVLELDPYIMVTDPSAKIRHLSVSASSNYMPAGTNVTFDYIAEKCFKYPHSVSAVVYMNTTVEDLSIPLNHYIHGFDLHYTVGVKSLYKYSNMDTPPRQNQIAQYMGNIDDDIAAIYRCGEETICAYRSNRLRQAPIHRYVIRGEDVNIEPVAKMTTLEYIDNITNISPTQFKDILAFVVEGKSKGQRLFEYLIALTPDKMYKLATIVSDAKSNYLAVDSRFNQLILHNSKSNELIAISITDHPHIRSRVLLEQNCSANVFPTAVLYCPFAPQLIVASKECGIQVFNTSGYPYRFSYSISLDEMFNRTMKDSLYKVVGIYGCDRLLYVVLARHGILKFYNENGRWTYEDTVPNYDHGVLTKFAAFEGIALAVYGYNSTSQFIRVFDLSLSSHATPMFDVAVNTTELCKRLVLMSTGKSGIYHLFYTCADVLFHTTFTFTPSIRLTGIAENTFNISINASSNQAPSQATMHLILKAETKMTFGPLYPLIAFVVLGTAATLFLYCWAKEVRDRSGYTSLIKELKEYEQNKRVDEVAKRSMISQANSGGEGLLIQ